MVGEEVRCIQLSINYGRQTDLLNILCSAGKNISINVLLVPTFFFGSYIFISQLLVLKLINTCYFRHFRQSTDENI